MADSNADVVPSKAVTQTVDAVVVGAGFSGLYQLYLLREQGFSVKVFEAGSDVGGTWYWNRYPGARCDVESVYYSYSFSDELQKDWNWTERFATQPEILSYIHHVADRFDLRRDVQLDTRVKSATFDENTNRWRVETDQGDVVDAQFFIMAVGCLSSSKLPELPGLESFSRPWYHTGLWPKEGVDFTGLQVGVIGTGSSGIQAIPEIAKQAAHLFVFQRTPNFSIPARNAPLDPVSVAAIKANYADHRERSRQSRGGLPVEPPTKSALEVSAEERTRNFAKAWETGGPLFLGCHTDLLISKEANDTAVEFVHDRIREIVKDPSVADMLLPRSFPIGAKRICVDTGYYDTFNRDNVTLVDLTSAPIREITETGLRTEASDYELDALVFATGFDAMTGSILNVDIIGAGGISLRDKWCAGPRTYLGLAVAGFPNMFIITGPGSPSVFSNMMTSIEQHVEWVANCLAHLRKNDMERIEADVVAQDKWVDHVNQVANYTLLPKANSWYLGANVPGKPRVFMPYVGGVGAYRQICDGVAAKNYEGFILNSAVDTNVQFEPVKGTINAA